MTVSRWHFPPRGRDKAVAQKPHRDKATGQSATRSSLTLTQQRSSNHQDTWKTWILTSSTLSRLVLPDDKLVQTVADVNQK